MGLGGASGIAGGIVGGISKGKEAALKDRCPNYVCDSDERDTKDTIKRMNLTADIMFGLAGAAAVTSIVLFFVEPKRGETSKVGVVPHLGTDRLGLSVEGRF